jgi:hypothetical protein
VGPGQVLREFEWIEMITQARRIYVGDHIEVICALLAAMSALTIAIGLFIPTYVSDEVSFKLLLSLVLASLPSVMFGVAAILHVRTHRRSALLAMVILGSINNALIAMPGLGLMYLLAAHQVTEGLTFMFVNFLSVLVTLAAAITASAPFRDSPQPVNHR